MLVPVRTGVHLQHTFALLEEVGDTSTSNLCSSTSKVENMTKLLKKTAIAAGIASMCLAGVASATVLNPLGGSLGALTAPQTVAYDGVDFAAADTLFDSISFSMTNTAQSNTATIASAIGGWGWASFATSLWSTADTSGTEWAIGTSVNNGGGAW